MRPVIQRINYEKTFPLRQLVMDPEKPLEKMKRHGDENAIHFGAIFDDQIVGVVSFYEEKPNDWRIRGMAVHQDFQKKGIGKALIIFALKDLKTAKRVWCNSRLEAVGFYKRLGFTPFSETIFIPNIGKRIKMELVF